MKHRDVAHHDDATGVARVGSAGIPQHDPALGAVRGHPVCNRIVDHEIEHPNSPSEIDAHARPTALRGPRHRPRQVPPSSIQVNSQGNGDARRHFLRIDVTIKQN